MGTLLDQPVLVLNRLWQAIQTCSARRAFALLYQGHAEVVEGMQTFDFSEWHDFSQGYAGDDVVNTVRFKIRVPKIIVLLFFDRMPKQEVKFTRHNIFERDRNTCQYCGKMFSREDLNLDHVVPRDRGGRMTWENIVCSCIKCNTRKANRTPVEAGMHLVRKPVKPKWRPTLHLTFSKRVHESWRHFLDLAYWNVELGDPGD
jgi:5-methylcytosine-specific restriction endonuclease McrA